MRMISIAMLASVAVGCGAKAPKSEQLSAPEAPAPASQASSQPTAPATARAVAALKGDESGKMGTGAPLSESGCYWLSADGARVACVHHVLEMGYVTSTVTVRPVKGGAVTSEHVVFDGPIERASGIRADGVAAVNAIFAEGGFAQEGRYLRGEKLHPEAASVAAPEVKGEASQCCEMSPAASTRFDRVGQVAVVFEIRCNYTADPKGGVCFIEDYNDESHPHDAAFVLQAVK